MRPGSRPIPTTQGRRFAVIMAGGSSTRLWPLSRERLPKQFLPLPGPDTLLQATVRRVEPLVGADGVVVVASRSQLAVVRRQLPHIPRGNLLAEPAGRNTAACLRLATGELERRHGDITVIALPADHAIQDDKGLRHTLSAAADLAERRDAIVLVGVRPDRPAPGYGYIALGEPLRRRPSPVWRVRRFIEKPTVARAQRLIATGGTLWNAGMFVWRASSLRRALTQCAPDFEARFAPARTKRQLAAVYGDLAPAPLDTLLLEPLSRRSGGTELLAVAAQFGWDDIGSWDRLAEVFGSDLRANTTVGRALCINASNNVVHSSRKPVVMLGVHDLVVVIRDDVALIVSRQDAQRVREVPRLLREHGWNQYL